MDAERIIEAVWSRWEAELPVWDLEVSSISAEARRLAVEAVAALINEGRVQSCTCGEFDCEACIEDAADDAPRTAASCRST